MRWVAFSSIGSSSRGGIESEISEVGEEEEECGVEEEPKVSVVV